MGYKAKFENGYTVEFDHAPTDAELEEAHQHIKSMEQPGVLDHIAGFGEGVLNVGSSLMGGAAQGIRALGEMAGGADLNTALERSQSSADAITYEPRTELGQEYAKGAQNLLQNYQQTVANKFAHDTDYLAQQKMNKGTLTPSDLAAANTERMVGEIIGGAYVPGLAKPSKPGEIRKGKGKVTPEESYIKQQETSPTPDSNVMTEMGQQLQQYGTSPTGGENVIRQNGEVSRQPAAQPNTFNRMPPAGPSPMENMAGQLERSGLGQEYPAAYKQLLQEQEMKQGEQLWAQQQIDARNAANVADTAEAARQAAMERQRTEMLQEQQALRQRLDAGDQGVERHLAEVEGRLRDIDKAMGGFDEALKKTAEEDAVARQRQVQAEIEQRAAAEQAAMNKRYSDENIGGEQVQREVMQGVDERLGQRQATANFNQIQDALSRGPREYPDRVGPEVPNGEQATNAGMAADAVQSKVDNHPRVQAAEKAVTKQEELLIKLMADVKAGRKMPMTLAKAKRDLVNLEKARDETRQRVEAAVRTGKSAIPFNFKNQGGAINTKLFEGPRRVLKERDVGEFKFSLIGGGGPHDTVAVSVSKGGTEVAHAIFSPKYDVKGDLVDWLESDKTHVDPEFRRQKMASAMYKWLSNHGNDILPSSNQTPAGKAMWQGFEKNGLSQDGTIKSPGNRQKGAVLISPGKGPQKNFFENHPNFKDVLGAIVPRKETVEQWHDRVLKYSNDVQQNALQKLANFGTKGGLYQALKTHHPLIEGAVERVNEADRLSRGDIQAYVHDRLAKAARDLSKDEFEGAWKVLDYHDLNQKPMDIEAMRASGMSEKQIKFIETHREVMDAAFKHMNDFRENVGLDPISKRVSYAAMRATGDFRRIVTQMRDGEPHIVGIISAGTRGGLNKLVEQMKAKGYDVGKEQYFGGLPRERGDASAQFAHAMQALAKDDPRVAEFISVLEDIYKNEAYSMLGMRKHALPKKGVFGMEGRKPWEDSFVNAKEGMQAQTNYAEAAFKVGRMSEAAADIRQLLKDEKVQENMPEASKWVQSYLQNAMGYNPEASGRLAARAVSELFNGFGVGYSYGRALQAGMRRTINTVLLSLNPRFLFTQMIQPFQAMPGMKAYLESKGLKGGFDFGTGYSWMAKAGITEVKEKLGKLDAFEKQAVDYAKSHHVYGSDLIEHSNRVRKDFGYAAEKTFGAGAQAVESATRKVVYLGFTHMLKENGMKVSDGLFETAHNLTDMAMNNYSRVDRPKVYNALGPLGDMAVNLSSYKHNEMSRLALFTRDLVDDVGIKNARPAATQLLTSVAFAGISGMIAFQEADWLVKQVSKLFGHPLSLTDVVISLSEMAGSKVNEMTGAKKDEMGDARHVLSHGGFSFIGLDMSKSLGMQEIFGNSLLDVALPGAGKLWDIGAAGVNAVAHPTEMNAKRLVREASPGGVTGVEDRAWFSSTNKQGQELAHNRNDDKAQVVRTDLDKTYKTFGFTGVHEAAQKDKIAQEKYYEQAYEQKRAQVLKQMGDILFNRPMSMKQDLTVLANKYVNDFHGDPNSLKADLSRIAKEQRVPEDQRMLLRAVASRSITNAFNAKRMKESFSR